MKLGREIELWLVNTDQPPETIHQAEQWLDVEELQNADKFLRSELRGRHILRRAALRRTLATYLDIAPFEVQFEYGSLGKPRTNSSKEVELHFNLSHSGTRAAIAVCAGSQIGIDIERKRTIKNAAGIIERFYSANEWQAFSQLPLSEQNTHFLKSWTCKEAYLKATGDGLSFPLDRVEVQISRATDPPRLVKVEGRPNEIEKWSVIDLPENADLIGAIVVEGEIRPVRQREFVFN